MLVITDNNFNVVSTFDIAINQTRQSFEYYDGHLYYSNFEYGQTSQYEAVYDEVLEPYASVIYVFDKDGKYTSTLYVPPYNNQTVEIEGTAIDDNGDVFMLFNNWSTGKVEICKVNYDKESTVTIEVPITSQELNLNNYTFKARLYDGDGKSIDTYQTSNGKFNFTLSLNGVGETLYEFKQIDIGNDEVNVDTNLIEITVDSKYTLYKDEVVSTYTLSRTSFNNERAQVVDAPYSFSSM